MTTDQVLNAKEGRGLRGFFLGDFQNRQNSGNPHADKWGKWEGGLPLVFCSNLPVSFHVFWYLVSYRYITILMYTPSYV